MTKRYIAAVPCDTRADFQLELKNLYEENDK